MIATTIIAAALAAPAAAQVIRGVQFQDTFDNRDGHTPVTEPIGDSATGALSYNGWQYYDAALESNVVPATGPNVAAFFSSGEIQAGQDVWKPRNSSVLSFNQQSFAYGCVTNSEGPAVAVTCTLQASAQRVDGTTVVQNLAYNPREIRNALNTTTFPLSFTNLQSLTIQVLSSAAPIDTVAPLIDNNTYVATIRTST